MAQTVSDELKATATSHSGSMPICKLEVYPISGHIGHSKGLKMRVYNSLSDTTVVREGYCPLVAFSWGSSPPLGVLPQMLADGKTWSMKLTGYFRPQIPEGYTGSVQYTFGYVSTGFVVFDLQGWGGVGMIPSPHEINEIASIGTNADLLKLEVTYMRADTTGQQRKLKDERFVLYWKDDIDNVWRVMGADATSPPTGDFENISGTPVTAVSEMEFSTAEGEKVYNLLTIHVDGSDYYFTKFGGDDTKFPFTPGQTIRHNLNPGVAGGTFVTITWNTSVNNADIVAIWSVLPEEEPWIVKPTSVDHQMSKSGASQLSFSVPMTTGGFDERNVTRENMFTFNLDTMSYGILRPNRLVEFSAGYMVNGQQEYVKRFTGFIENIQPRHSKRSDGTIEKTLDVTCLDARVQAVGQPVTKIEDMGISPLPNDLSYDIAGIFTTDIEPSKANGAIRPPAFDSWNLADVIRTVLTQNGYLSSQLYAKDAHGNFLIEDRGVRLERTPAYPHRITTTYSGRTEKKEWMVRDFQAEWKLSLVFGVMGWYQPRSRWIPVTETQEIDYLYQFNIDDDPISKLTEVCESYGLQFGQNACGNVYMRYPNNPIIKNTHADDADGGDKASYTSSTLTDTSKSWGYNQWKQGQVMITNGLGAGQTRRVSSNTSTKLNIYPTWDTIPNNKSWYVVVKDEEFLSNNITYDTNWDVYPSPGQTDVDTNDFRAVRCMYHKGGGMASTTLENVGHIYDAGYGNRVWYHDGVIYLANYTDGIRAYDFDGTSFTNIGHIDDVGCVYAVYGDGYYIYAACGDDGLQAYTFDGSTFVNVGSIDNGGTAYGVFCQDNFIFLANGADGYRAYTFNGTAFTNVAHIDNGGTANGIWSDGYYFYGANSDDGIRAYTFNGSAFTNVGHRDDGGQAMAIHGIGDFIFLANLTDGIRAYTFNGTNFTLVGHKDVGGQVRDVWCDGSYVYVANGLEGFIVYQFTGLSFKRLGYLDNGGSANGVFGDGTHVYVANWGDGLRAYSFNDTGYTAVASVVFTGVGLKMLFPRPVSTSMARIEIDGVVVNGANELDASTGDKGHTDWLDRVLDSSGKVSLAMDYSTSVDPWFYRHGVHPEAGVNPAILTICDDLTYDTHVAVITVMNGDVCIEGFATITDSREKSQHDFDAYHDLSELRATESMADHVNDVVVVGNMTGAAGDYITSRATDINSIGNASAINYVGKRKPLLLSHPHIVNQDMADYLAQHTLMRYRRSERKPVVRSAGMPWLEIDDAITIKDLQAGYYAPWQLSETQRQEIGKAHVSYGSYWIESLTEKLDMSGAATSYTMEISTTNRPPLPAFEPTPEPVQSDFYYAIDGLYISIDGGSGTYNPFLEEAEGKYVNVEFALTWHARNLVVRVVAGEHIEKDFGDGAEVTYDPGDTVQVIMSQSGFVPAGKYECTWDGWAVLEDSSGMGFYAPDGTYYIELRTENYDTGEAFVYRSDRGLSNIMRIGSKEYITIAQDRDAVYGSDPFDVDVWPIGTLENPPVIYDWETNDGQGMKIEVTLDCPARLSININYKHMIHIDTTPPVSTDEEYQAQRAKAILRPDTTEILEPGTYTFYFNPRSHTGIGRDIPRSFVEVMPNVTTAQLESPAWVCWYYSLYKAICFQDLSGKREYITPSTIAFMWGGQYEGQYTTADVYDKKGYYTFFKIE